MKVAVSQCWSWKEGWKMRGTSEITPHFMQVLALAWSKKHLQSSQTRQAIKHPRGKVGDSCVGQGSARVYSTQKSILLHIRTKWRNRAYTNFPRAKQEISAKEACTTTLRTHYMNEIICQASVQWFTVMHCCKNQTFTMTDLQHRF